MTSVMMDERMRLFYEHHTFFDDRKVIMSVANLIQKLLLMLMFSKFHISIKSAFCAVERLILHFNLSLFLII